MPLFHVPTIYAMTLLVMTLLGLLLVFAWLQNRSVRALLWWGGGNIAMAAALGLLFLRGHIPQFLSLDLAYVILFSAAGMILQGALMFDGRRISPWLVFGGAVLWFAACQVPSFYESVTARTVLVSATISIYVGSCALSFYAGRRERLLSRWPLIVLLAINSALFGIRIPLSLIYPLAQSAVNSIEALQSPWFAAASASVLLFTAAMNFLFLAMVKERAESIQKHAAMTDPLTGLLNRRALIERAEEMSGQGGIALAMFDLDRFKSINDEFGHATGDAVLNVFAAAIRPKLNGDMAAGRLGGEEFALIWRGKAAEDMYAFADAIRRKFAVAACEVDGKLINATLSAGIAAAPAAGASLSDLMKEADRNLYCAKSAGRDRIVFLADAPALAPQHAVNRRAFRAA